MFERQEKKVNRPTLSARYNIDRRNIGGEQVFTSMFQPRFSERENPRALVDAEIEKLTSEYELTHKKVILIFVSDFHLCFMRFIDE